MFFFFKQKTAYEMRISDWSSDVCSSDLSPDEHCIIRDVFELIEEKTIDGIEQCGRCPACRARAQHPPRTIHCQGLEGAWPCSGDAGPVELPAGTTLVVPEDPTYETGLEDRKSKRLNSSH